tara:strand:+ start:115 stop:261 length:147 start_codon:yes stop_codon:yes gene_type:complete
MFDYFNKNLGNFVKQIPNKFSIVNTKLLIYFGLGAYWSVMLLGTFIGL